MSYSFTSSLHVAKHIALIRCRYASTKSAKDATKLKHVTAGKRIPLIKFGRRIDKVSGTKAATAKDNASKLLSKGPVIQDWELPPKYRRKPIDKDEMEYINRGGPP